MSSTAAASLAASTMVHSATAANSDPRPLRLAVIGCGGRGRGAIDDSLTINSGVTLVAAASDAAAVDDIKPRRLCFLRGDSFMECSFR